ncbi:MAG: sigma-70 family RNA polymerase sigma factor [Erysipelotrichaceae bacterium]|nr:sigma-70 family RNA polymerase sigma factor [Erysipelotrichaceae bacterium]
MNNINTIIQRLKEGDKDAFEKLLSVHHNMIYKIINGIDRSLGDYIIDEKDLYQEASLALYEAAESFEPERKVKFSTYAYVHIKNNLLNYVKKYRRRYRDDIYSFDINPRSMDFQVADSTRNSYNENQFKEELEKFLGKLNEEDRMILLMRGSDYSYKEIAEKLNTSTKRVDNKLRVLKQRLKKSRILEYLTCR